MDFLLYLAQTEETAKVITDTTKQVLNLGVPGILLLFLGLTLVFGWKGLLKLVAKIEVKDSEIKTLSNAYSDKIQELMERIVSTNGQLVTALEKNNSSRWSLEKVIKDNEVLITELKAELDLIRRQRKTRD